MSPRVIPQCLFGVYCLALAYGLFRPQMPPDLFENSDKVEHLLAFAALALSARLAFTRFSPWLLWPLLAAMAPLLEWLQHLLQPVRNFSQVDAVANLSGIVLGWLLFQGGVWLKRWLNARRGASA